MYLLLKVSPEYISSEIIIKTSDDFFKSNKKTFDTIFIYGMHQVEYILRDFNKAVNIEGHNIGLWQNTQKHRFKIGKLSNDRINKLKKIDFIFEKVLDVKWDNCFEASKKFYQLNGYANCKFNYVVDGITLGRWQARQRENYRKNRLTQDQIDKLKSIEFVFEGNYYKLRQNESTWNKYYESSKSFLNEYGNANCKNRTIYQGLKLGLWQNSQRAYYNSGKLSKERVDKLEKIGFLWSLPHGGSKEWRKWKSSFKKPEN